MSATVKRLQQWRLQGKSGKEVVVMTKEKSRGDGKVVAVVVVMGKVFAAEATKEKRKKEERRHGGR